MNKEEIKDFIALHYNTYINKIVHFKSSGLTARIKAIEPIEGDNGDFDAYCYLENPDEKDPSFKDHIYAHLSLQTVIDEGRLIL
ncbi:MAG TPA: hypothetical protein PL029_05605 [Bacteroidia bacterium]|nr:hypothetical protein [Bacteroidia bacterium]